MIGRAAGVLVIATVGAALAAPAGADTRLTGETTDSVDVVLRVGFFGNATAFKVAAHKVKCDHGTVHRGKRIYRNFVFSDPGSFLIRRRGSRREGDTTLRIKTRIRGRIAADNRTWSGIYKSIIRVYENGEQIDSCRVRSVWHVY